MLCFLNIKRWVIFLNIDNMNKKKCTHKNLREGYLNLLKKLFDKSQCFECGKKINVIDIVIFFSEDKAKIN